MVTKHITGTHTKMIQAKLSDTLYVLDKDASITITGPDFAVGIFGPSDMPVKNRDFKLLGDIHIESGIGLGLGSNNGLGGGDVLIAKSSEVMVQNGTALVSSGDHTHFTNNGYLSGTNTVVASGDYSRLDNNGTISGSQVGVDMGGPGTRIENHGSIQGSTIAVDIGFDGGTILNDGDLLSTSGVGIRALVNGTATLKIINSGSIQVGDDAIQLSNLAGAKTIITNTGEITAGDYAILGNYTISTEIVRNSGSIAGRVYLGDGNDVYDGRGGTASDVSGGNQNDRYIVSDTTTNLYEHANEGTDTVKASVNWTLKTDFENLTLFGQDNITGKGNDAANILRGNAGSNFLYGFDGTDNLDGGKGDDSLFGGFKADTFVFSNGSGHDKIMDFENGSDVIDLRKMDGLDSFADIQAAAKAVGSDMVLTFAGGETLQIVGYNAPSMTQDDFMF